MTKRQLNETMDAQEVLEWMAYEMSIDCDKNKQYMKELADERARNMSLADEAQAIKNMLLMLGGK